jgi:hypothetical protein
MTEAKTRDPIYRGRRFESETIELCVRWYITYRLSYPQRISRATRLRPTRWTRTSVLQPRAATR